MGAKVRWVVTCVLMLALGALLLVLALGTS
jgi:hypothetical protein